MSTGPAERATRRVTTAAKLNIAFGLCLAAAVALVVAMGSGRTTAQAAIAVGVLAGAACLVGSGVLVARVFRNGGAMAVGLLTGIGGAVVVAASLAALFIVSFGSGVSWKGLIETLGVIVLAIGMPAAWTAAALLIAGPAAWQSAEPLPADHPARRTVRGGVFGGLGLMVVIVAMGAALMPTRHTVNRGNSAAGVLRTLCTAQEQFRAMGAVDQDSDGEGEYGWLGELAGTQPVRGGKQQFNTSPFIAAVLGVRDASGLAHRGGYCFAMYLRGADGRWHREPGTPPGTIPAVAPSQTAAADGQEQEWRCYAWPLTLQPNSQRAFVTDQTGTVYATGNVGANQQYWGNRAPAPEAAYGPDGAAVATPDSGVPATDGGEWRPID